MGRRRSHERRDLPPNLYIRNNGYYCYRDPRTGKEFGLGRDRRIAITEAIQANIELFSGHKHKPLTGESTVIILLRYIHGLIATKKSSPAEESSRRHS
ncbi:TPA: phage integrase Arm DNA-binding domain-containing protein [Escherichia coli]|nr:phage integrase Arm DNA-binding domain-containing protein [Escherichia coli]HDZ4027995.1 phage integrase Arm DNA-binding domain-containing protein [Escherichia coli]